MDLYRIRHTIGMCLCSIAIQRAEYLKEKNIFRSTGDNCMTMFRKVPLYPKLISLGDNVWIASGVSFCTHDVIHQMLNNCVSEGMFQEHIGCIDIKDNVFVGTNVTILPNVSIGPNAIVAAGALVNRSIQGGVYAGVSAKYVCSLEEFMNKRDGCPTVKITRGRNGLSEDTVEECWRRFRKMEIAS